MKNLILIFFFAQLLILPMGLVIASQTAQSATEANYETTSQPTVEKTGFFQKIGDKVNDLWGKAKEGGLWLGIMFVCGILSRNGITKLVKKIAGKGDIITKEVIDIATASNQFFKAINGSIADDGTVKQNSLKEAMEAGKTVIAEVKEGYQVIIKPKPV